MAANFKILVHRSSESLHLKLVGDFDGTSACEVIHALSENGGTRRIYIHTAGVKEVHDFGRAVFQNHYPLKDNQEVQVVFTGEHASDIAPASN